MDPNTERFNQRRPEVVELPGEIQIETIFGCNLRCPMCPVPSAPKVAGRPARAMSTETFDRIIEQISDRPRKVSLNIMGEPTLNKHLPRFIRQAREAGHYVWFTTNATRLSDELAEQLIEAGLNQVNISFDGATPGTYEQIRVGAKYVQVVDNIRRFWEANDAAGRPIKVEIHCIRSALTEAEIEDHAAMFSGLCDVVRTLPLSSWAGQFLPPDAMGGVRDSELRRRGERWPCHLLWRVLSISPEGRVMLCCHDYKQTSNLPTIHERPLIDIWRDALGQWRRDHLAGRFPGVCAGCEWEMLPEFIGKPRTHAEQTARVTISAGR